MIGRLLQVSGDPVPAGAARAHGLDVDGHDPDPDRVARDGGYLREHLPAQVLASRRGGEWQFEWRNQVPINARASRKTFENSFLCNVGGSSSGTLLCVWMRE